MPAVEQNIILEKGADYEVVGWITDDFGNYIDISGDTFRAEVRTACGSALIASFTFNIQFNATEGRYEYVRSMPQATINAITEKQAIWDQFWESAAGKSAKMFEGSVTIECNVTDPTV